MDKQMLFDLVLACSVFFLLGGAYFLFISSEWKEMVKKFFKCEE